MTTRRRGNGAASTHSSSDGRTTGTRASRLDEVDLAIMDALQSNSKITNAELADRVGMSPPSTLERVKKLEQRGFIKGYVAILSAKALNKTTQAIVSVALREHGADPLTRVKSELAELEEIRAFWHTAGEEDFILKVLVTDMDHYEDFVTNKLSSIRGIGRIKTAFVLRTCKDETRIPLDAIGE